MIIDYTWVSGICSVTDPKLNNASRFMLKLAEHTWGSAGNSVDNVHWSNDEFDKLIDIPGKTVLFHTYLPINANCIPALKKREVYCFSSVRHTIHVQLLLSSNFSFSHSVFCRYGELSGIFIKFEFVVCKLFQFGRVKNLSSGKGLLITLFSATTHHSFFKLGMVLWPGILHVA